jgi:hypothetical protein
MCEQVLEEGQEGHRILMGHKNGNIFPTSPVPVIGIISGTVVSLSHSRKYLSSKSNRALRINFLLDQ